MRHHRGNIARLFLASGLVLLIAACTGDTYQESVALGPDPLTGLLVQAPDLAGSWEFSLTTGTDGCGIEFFPPTAAGVLAIDQADSTIVLTVLDACGATVTTGSGTVGHDGVATFTWEEIFTAGGSCRLTLTTVAAGAADAAAVSLDGTFTLTVAPADDDQSCSATFPCEISGGFAADRCPEGGCAPAACGD
jgi:hypothetical protein